MRSISSPLAALALTATLTSAFAPSIADACGGGYGVEMAPAVFALDQHHITRKGSDQRVAFVLFGRTTPSEKLTWTRLWPGSFDSTRTADAPDTAPTTVTLIGPSGARVVTSGDRTFVADSFRSRQEQLAMEVGVAPDAELSVAVLGAQPDAKWIKVSEIKTRGSTAAWLRTQGVAPTTVYSSLVEGTYYQVISTYQDGHDDMTSVVRMGNRSLGQYTGRAIGALDLGGKRYVLFETNGLITPAAL